MNRRPPRRSLFHALLSALAGKAPEQAKQHVQPPQRPANDDCDAWRAYWKEQGQSWRTEPEIDVKRQEYLAERRIIQPDIEHGIYPFKDIKLKRADVEWLLATLDGRGPVDWSDESQRNRNGLDLRGANLREEDLQALPLACLIGGLSLEESMTALFAEHEDEGLIHLDDTNLYNAHLEGARLSYGYLEGADLSEAHLEDADLTGSHLESAWLDKAHLKDANLQLAHLIAANLDEAYLEKADLRNASAEGAFLDRAHLEQANLTFIHLEKASLKETFLNNANLSSAQLAGANLRSAHLEGADLSAAHLGGNHIRPDDLKRVRKWFHGLRWRGMEDVLDWEDLEQLKEEFPEELPPADLREAFFDAATKLDGIILGESHYGWVRLADIHWGDVNLAIVKWSQVQMLGDEHRATLKRHNGKVKDRAKRLNDYERAVRANRQLAVVLQSQGLNEDARLFAYRAQLLQKTVFRFQMLQLNIKLRQRIRPSGAWLFSWFLFLLAGYGYKPGRSFFAYLLVIGTFMALYLLLDPHLLWYEALVVSMTAFHGRGFSPSTFTPGDPLSIASAVEAFVGLIIEVTFIATLTRRFFGQ